MGPSNSSYLSNMAFFHFHDYGRKSNPERVTLNTIGRFMRPLGELNQALNIHGSAQGPGVRENRYTTKTK